MMAHRLLCAKKPSVASQLKKLTKFIFMIEQITKESNLMGQYTNLMVTIRVDLSVVTMIEALGEDKEIFCSKCLKNMGREK